MRTFCRKLAPKGIGGSATSTLSPLAALLMMGAPLLADPLKTVMGEMARTTKVAKAALSSHDPATFDAILTAYADEARAGIALVPGSDAKGRDVRARFAAFAATADAARPSGGSPATFRAAFGTLAGECRSCHAAYK